MRKGTARRPFFAVSGPSWSRFAPALARVAGVRSQHLPARSERAQPRNLAVVRKPVWATMRWSGRTAWPSTYQPRCSTSRLLVPFQAFEASAVAQLRDLDDRRRVGDEDAAGTQVPPSRAARPATARAGRARLGRCRARRCRRSSRAARRGSAPSHPHRGSCARWPWPDWRSPRAARSRRSLRPTAASSCSARRSRHRSPAPVRPGPMSASMHIGARSFG